MTELVAKGWTTKEIATALRVSDRAVTAVLSRLFRRYGVSNRAGLIASLLAERPAGHRERFAAYEDVPFMVAATVGPEHRYVFMNAVASQVAGIDASLAIGRAILEIYPDLDPAFKAALDEVLRTGRAAGFTNAPARFTRPDGTHLDTRLNLIFQPLRDDTGEVTGILHIGTTVAD